MAEAGEGLALGHQADDDTGQQGAEGDHVVSPAAPDEQPHAGDENGEDLALFEGHGAGLSLWRARAHVLYVAECALPRQFPAFC